MSEPREEATRRQDLIRNTPELIRKLREYTVAIPGSPDLHPEICTVAADTLEAYSDLENIVQLGRHNLNDLNEHGKTILDFFNVWLDQARDEATALRRKIEFVKEMMKDK